MNDQRSRVHTSIICRRRTCKRSGPKAVPGGESQRICLPSTERVGILYTRQYMDPVPNEHDFRRRRNLTNPLRRLQSPQFWQTDIEEDQIGLKRCGFLNGVQTIRCLSDDLTLKPLRQR
jgi:hypothetical protein